MRKRHPLFTLKLVILFAPGLATLVHARTPDFELEVAGSRLWLGPQCLALPMQDWSVEDGVIVGRAAADRGVSLMPCQTSAAASFEASTVIELRGIASAPAEVRAGFRIGTKGSIDDWRRVALLPEAGVPAGLRADGRAFVAQAVSDTALTIDGPVVVSVRYDAEAGTLTATARHGESQATVTTPVDASDVTGGVMLIAHSPARRPSPGDPHQPAWRFDRIELSGPGLSVHAERTFGPILWTQYTLSDQVLKLSAQMPPIGRDDAQTVGLEIDLGRGWQRLADAPIDPDARTATFRVAGWSSDRDVPYRVVYAWLGRSHTWSGIVRRDPADEPTLDLAAFSCDNGYAFPAPRLVDAVRRHDPDLLFFAGDQIYENYGGFGLTRGPVEAATIDYLRKWLQFGWTWRELMRDRPTVIIPDDHDVYQGNLWGDGGRIIPEGKPDEWGGYRMPVRWVNMVQRTQTSHLPDPVDPQPTESGVGVYFTAMTYGGLRWAILEDRKFKSGPQSLFARHQIANPRQIDVRLLDLPDATLLGERQLAFLDRWGASAADDAINVVLSQTMFAQVFTHGGPMLKRNTRDLDTNAWPQSPRRRALETIVRSGAIMICGDQHLGALVHHGIARYGDGPIQFMVPGTANGWPRAAWPGVEEDNPASVGGPLLGRRIDPFGSPIEVLGVANPLPRSNQAEDDRPEDQARAKGSGFGIVRFDKARGEATFDLRRYPAAADGVADSFEGFPVTLPAKRVDAAGS